MPRDNNSNNRKVLALMFVVTGIVLLMVSFILPWWGYHTEIGQTSTDGYYTEAGFGLSISSGISNARSGTSFYIGDFSTPAVYGITALFMILALIFATLMATTIILNLIGQKTKTKLPMKLGILAMIFCLLAPIIFMAALPVARRADEEKSAEDRNLEYEEPDHDDPTKSFFGSYEDDDGSLGITKSNWGGDIGWVMSFVSFVFLLISVIQIKPTRPPHPSSYISPELSYKPEPEQRMSRRDRYDRDRPQRRERSDWDRPSRRSYRPSSPPHDNFEYDYSSSRQRNRPRY